MSVPSPLDRGAPARALEILEFALLEPRTPRPNSPAPRLRVLCALVAGVHTPSGQLVASPTIARSGLLRCIGIDVSTRRSMPFREPPPRAPTRHTAGPS